MSLSMGITIIINNASDIVMVSTDPHIFMKKYRIHIPTHNPIQPRSLSPSAVMLSQEGPVFIVKISKQVKINTMVVTIIDF